MKTCKQLWMADALEDGSLAASEATSFERHARVCAECRDRARLDERLRGLVERLPVAAPADLRLRRLRARILSDAREAATAPRARWARALRIGAAALVVGLLAMAILVIHRRSLPSRGEPFAGSVTAPPGAKWSQSRTEKVETVTLTEGELWMFVRKQAPDERFLVDTPDGELEVRGTTFHVLVHARSTRQVRVVEGLVALHLQGRPSLELAAGETWDIDAPEAIPRPVPVASAAPASPAPPAFASATAAPVVQATAPVAVRQTSTESQDYATAMDLYRGAHYLEAAESFRRFAAQHRDSGLLEDASFLEAVSLTKAGHVDAGAVAAWRHVTAFPSSFHKKEASLLVARAARDRGDCVEARRSLAPWLGSNPDAAIREALGACAEP
jgi:TolA-binding protein